LLVLAVAIGIRAIGWSTEFVRNPRGPSRRWLPASLTEHWFATFVVVSIVYVLVRNLFPLA
jgi:hypothetical protein